MCHDYNPRIPDCGVQLAGLYTNNGLLVDAYTIIQELIKLSKPSRMGISHFKTWNCDLPKIVNIVQGYRLMSNTTQFSTAEMKYMLLLVSLYINNRYTE
jgi:hypothetical protein